MNKPELLMPAGNLEKLKIAIINEADAVYFGSHKFNMRQRAENFSIKEVKEGIDFCHLYGKRAYITMNIALKDSELKEAIDLAKQLYIFGVDALIVQDLGLIKALKKLLPELELHASTQLTCNNLQGAKYLADLGLKKIVLAREMSLKEIKEVSYYLHKKKVEVEVFAHGAECFSYSGQCLFSSFAFNKSGNRGMCLQPCRLAFQMNEGDKKRYLSMKDLCTYKITHEMIEAGIDSFKIEGRLKSNEYIQNVARVYRKKIDKYFNKKAQEPSLGEIRELQKSYLRGHGALYLKEEKERTTIDTVGNLGLPAAQIIGFKEQGIIVNLLEDLDRNDKLTRIIDSNYESFLITKMISFGKFINYARKGQTILLEISKRPYLQKDQILYLTTPKKYTPGKKLMINYKMDIHENAGKLIAKINIPSLEKTRFKSYFEIESDFILENAKNKPLDKELLKDKLFKEYYFYNPKEFSYSIPQNKFVPLSNLKDFMRKIKNDLEGFENKIINENKFEKEKNDLFCFKENSDKCKPPTQNNKTTFKEKDLFVFLDDFKSNVVDKTKELNAKKIFYYNDELKQDFKKEAIVKTQNIQNTKELAVFEKEAVKGKWTIVVSNIGALQVALKNKLKFIIDREMNCYNSLAINYFVEIGAEQIVPSIELSLKEIESFSHRNKLIILLFYYPLLMTSKAYEKDNVFKKTKFTLSDRKDFDYRVRFENNLMKLYNPLPVDMLFEIEKFKKFNLLGIDLKETSTSEAIHLLKYYTGKIQNQNPKKKSKFTRGHYDNPVE